MSSNKARHWQLFSSTLLRRREPRPETSIGYRPKSAQNALQVFKIGLGPLATIDDIAGLWGRLMDRRREGRQLPDGVDAEALADKVRRLMLGEQLRLLELADRAAMAAGSLRERLVAAGVEG